MTTPHPSIPPLLSPYLSLPPPSSLILLTSVLGASTNWLLLRFLCAALGVSKTGGYASTEERGEGGGGDVRVVLVSFLRGWRGWREGGRRVVSSSFGWLVGWLLVFCFVFLVVVVF